MKVLLDFGFFFHPVYILWGIFQKYNTHSSMLNFLFLKKGNHPARVRARLLRDFLNYRGDYQKKGVVYSYHVKHNPKYATFMKEQFRFKFYL